MILDKFQAIVSLVGGGVSQIADGTINYHDGQSQPTEAEIDAEIIRLQAEWDDQAYARKRKVEYDALNQLELMSDDAINGTTTHKDAIVAIKTKYPKV
jgi:hypothetical protein